MEKKIISINLSRPEKVRIMLCQVSQKYLDFDIVDNIYFAKKTDSLTSYINDILLYAQKRSVSAIVFPELTICEDYINMLYNFAKNNNVIIIAGTHYKKEFNGYCSVCPVIISDKIEHIKKCIPSPYELSPIPENNLVAGDKIITFHNTQIGNFSIAICADVLDPQVVNNYDIDNLDFLIVPSFQKDSFTHHYNKMNSLVQDSENGLYILYSNGIYDNFADGNSGIFGIMYKEYSDKLINECCVNENFRNNLYQFKGDERFLIAEFDLRHKLPPIRKTIKTTPNFNIIERDTNTINAKYKFLYYIGMNGDLFENIDKYYVKPQQFDDILSTLREKNIVLILGDPGIGKTYTSIYLLYEFFKEGYTPKWITGLSKDDRKVIRQNLLSYEPKKNEICYFEDPFGKTEFEHMSELEQFLMPLIEKVQKSNSKMIITSRTQVFEQFTNLTYNSEQFENFALELNIQKPSYTDTNLIEISRKYIGAYTDWANDKSLTSIICSYIKRRIIVTPISLFSIIKNNTEKPTKKALVNSIKIHNNADQIYSFAHELESLSISKLIFLYTVAFLNLRPKNEVHDIYSKVCQELKKELRFRNEVVNSIVDSQNNYRIVVRDISYTTYCLSHPIYEEALLKLASKAESKTQIIALRILVVLYRTSSDYATKVLVRYLKKYPNFIYLVIDEIIDKYPLLIDTKFIIPICNSLLDKKIKNSRKKICSIFPIEKMLDNLYNFTIDSMLFHILIKIVYKRKDELVSNKITINWCDVYTHQLMDSLGTDILIKCFSTTRHIDEDFICKIENNFSKALIIKLMIAIRFHKQLWLGELLKLTKWRCVCSDVENLVIDESFQNKKTRKRKILSYILENEEIAGTIYVDRGAFLALKRGATLFPVGVIEVVGNFKSGDVVKIQYMQCKQSFLCVVDLDYEFINKYKGMRSQFIFTELEKVVKTSISKSKYRIFNK